jgi:flagellar biosynthesis/type III secretory pathway protein FliH
MSQTLTVHLEKAIASVRILGDSGPHPCEGENEGSGQPPIRDLQAEKTGFSQTCRTLNAVIARLNQFCDTLFAEHKEEIAKLSVEIARKILLQKVQDGDYEIEAIVKEALNNAPTREDVVVHLNPEDHLLCRKAQQDEPNGDLAGIKFVPDQNIGRAECLLETPKGIIESLIEEHLERIANALKKAE